MGLVRGNENGTKKDRGWVVNYETWVVKSAFKVMYTNMSIMILQKVKKKKNKVGGWKGDVHYIPN